MGIPWKIQIIILKTLIHILNAYSFQSCSFLLAFGISMNKVFIARCKEKEE